MQQTRTDTATYASESRAGSWLQAIVKGVTGMLEHLGPQPQLRPIPVRVRANRTPGNR